MTKDEQRELIERCYQLQELTRHPGWPILEELCRDLAAPRQRRVLTSGCKDWTEYKENTGWLSGVQAVLTAPEYAQKLVDRAVADET